MNIARHLALIDELCFRPFPAEHGPSDVGFGGPGHHVAVLETGDGPGGDPASRAVTADRFEKARDAVYEVLASRWGDVGPWDPRTVLPRTGGGETPGPWAWLGARVGAARLWEVQGTGRWVAVAVADRDPGEPVRLLAVVTETAPP